MSACKLKFECNKRWEDLTPVLSPSARFCSECRKAVFSVKTVDAFNLALELGRCVGIADDNDFIGVIGEPDLDWMEPGYFKGMSASLHQPIDLARLENLRLLFPKLFDKGGAEHLLLGGGSVAINELSPGARALFFNEIDEHAPELRILDGVPPNIPADT